YNCNKLIIKVTALSLHRTLNKCSEDSRFKISLYLVLLCENVGFFFNITYLTPFKVYENAENLHKYYHNDSSKPTFANECIHFRNLFPYVEIALGISCPTCSNYCFNCSAERYFSVLKRVKSYLLSRTTDERLNFLVVRKP
ncbi:zinc finger MYM-type protein 1-like, partial [Aphis craccivora]